MERWKNKGGKMNEVLTEVAQNCDHTSWPGAFLGVGIAFAVVLAMWVLASADKS